MYKMSPPAVLAHESVMKNPAYRAGVERVVAALAQPRPVETYADADLPDLIRKYRLLERRVPMGCLETVEDPILLFNTFRFNNEAEAAALGKRLAEQGFRVGHDLLGLGAFHWANYNLEGDPARLHKVCRPCWRIHLQVGCMHRCAYCPLGGLLACMVNVDEYCRHLKTIMDRHPWQKTFLLDDDADPPALEPELGSLSELITFFGTLDQRYLVVHTKTWNTGWLGGLKHNGNSIFVWSLSGPTQSRVIEPNAGTTGERIEAARVAQEAGYPVRYKFKPILPVRNWRREAAESVARVFERTRPDMISLCCFMWMTYGEMTKRLHNVIDILDPDCLRRAEEHQANADNPYTQPFPDDVRAEIYDHYLAEIRKHDATIPVSLSTESWQMWTRFAPKLGMTASNYVCGCGPQSVPGAKKLDCNAFSVAVRNDGGMVPCVRPPWEGPSPANGGK